MFLPFGHPKSRFLNPPSLTYRGGLSRQSGRPFRKLKDSRKNFCRPCNDVGRLSFTTSPVRKSGLRSKSPTHSSGKKPKKRKNYCFWPYFTCINMLCLAGLPFERPPNRSKNRSVDRLMMSVACILSGLRRPSKWPEACFQANFTV